MPQCRLNLQQELGQTHCLNQPCGFSAKTIESFLKELDVSQNDFWMKLIVICELCAKKKVKLYIDAEYSHLQPVVRALTLAMMKISDYIVYNTYQCYLKNSLTHLREDIKIARDLTFSAWGCKLVRGAYLKAEARSFQNKLIPEFPLHQSYADTNNSYDTAIAYLVDEMSKTGTLHVTLATHNLDSINKGLRLFRSNHSLKNQIDFAQINGLADPISLALAKEKVQVLKLLPCGSVEEVLPWLGR